MNAELHRIARRDKKAFFSDQCKEIEENNISQYWDFPGGSVAKTLPSNAGGAGSISSWGSNIPHASQPKNQNRNQKQYYNKFKDFKNDPHQKKS